MACDIKKDVQNIAKDLHLDYYHLRNADAEFQELFLFNEMKVGRTWVECHYSTALNRFYHA